MPDTGVFLNHAEDENGHFEIGTIAWRSLSQARILEEVRVVVPIVVIDELELIKDKRRIAEVRRNKARWTVNTLFDWFELEPGLWHLLRERTAQAGAVAVEILPDERVTGDYLGMTTNWLIAQWC